MKFIFWLCFCLFSTCFCLHILFFCGVEAARLNPLDKNLKKNYLKLFIFRLEKENASKAFLNCKKLRFVVLFFWKAFYLLHNTSYPIPLASYPIPHIQLLSHSHRSWGKWNKTIRKKLFVFYGTQFKFPKWLFK